MGACLSQGVQVGPCIRIGHSRTSISALDMYDVLIVAAYGRTATDYGVQLRKDHLVVDLLGTYPYLVPARRRRHIVRDTLALIVGGVVVGYIRPGDYRRKSGWVAYSSPPRQRDGSSQVIECLEMEGRLRSALEALPWTSIRPDTSSGGRCPF